MRALFGVAVLFLLGTTAFKQQHVPLATEEDYPALVRKTLEEEGLIKKRSSQPKLVVGIVIDQFRPDYLSRFADQFSEGGFKRLMKEGFYNRNTHYNYVPTYTGPGHASVYTGTTPAVHGIVGNSWYNRVMEESEYCAEDTSVSAVGSNSAYGNISAENLLTTTISDELELATRREAKVVGVAIKDRGAAFPAGHLADGAYWFDKKYGKFITSTYYRTELPAWVEAFNERRLPQQYMDSTWNTFLPLSEYEGSDDTPYEEVFKGKETATFPYDLSVLGGQNGNYNLFTYTPFANSVVTELAKAAVEGENMGADAVTDLLALSYSSTDILGHSFGPRSVEVQDMYLRLDRDIADLLNYLDETVGKGEYLVFLTADHAAAEVAQSLIDQKAPAGYFDQNSLAEEVEAFLQEVYGVAGLMEYATNLQFYLNHDLIYTSKLDLQDVQQTLAEFLRRKAGVAAVYTASQMQTEGYTEGITQKLQKGYYYKRSGDVLMVLDPAWIDFANYGTTHGSGYNYDAHVPLIWYGWGVEEGVSFKRQHITDIAPTLSFMLDISLPNGATGEPILELLEE
ncbi:alkaline phosphatase PafA [Nafulsella turpanensis]|uniref:alkaline phosphatase PafA n=1 Tax=Nafulsella turpanensis TaxID=1265690 RepID=UPI000347989B|nr:alkaline phosphatase PafA [Nafulsella turpanensis]